MATIGDLNGASSILSNPSIFGARAVNFRQENSTAITKTASGRTIRSAVATTIWRASIELTTYTQANFKQLQGFAALARGALNEFNVQLPGVSERSVTTTPGTITCLENYDVGSTSVDTSMASINASDNFKVLSMGDVIKFSNHNKVYMVTSDVIPDSGGDVQINFEPALVTAVTNSTTVTIDNVPFRMYFTSDLQEYQYNVDGTVNYRIDVAEAV
jgi:hypothetical protein